MDIATLKGSTLHSVTVDRAEASIEFVTTAGEVYRMFHEPDCCEQVWIEDVTGDVADLVGVPLLVAESRDNGDCERLPDSDDSFTWTFYELRTIKGSVTIRWYGTSNGYYSEEVDFSKGEAYTPLDTDTWAVAGDYELSRGQTGHAARYCAYFALGGN